MTRAFAASWWLQVGNEAARCKGPAKDRKDGRCHNVAHQDGLCKTHLRMAGKLSCVECAGARCELPDGTALPADERPAHWWQPRTEEGTP